MRVLSKADPPASAKDPERVEPVVIKKYANRRLYNTDTSTYVTLDDLAAMVKSGRDFVVFDAKSGDDLTHSVLTQIIVEQESRMGGQTLLPIPFLRQLIRFYGDSIESLRRLPETIDLFINDSDHSAEYEAGEYAAIAEKLSHDAIVLGDNSHVTDKLALFARQTGRQFLYFREQPKGHWYPGTGIGIAFRAPA